MCRTEFQTFYFLENTFLFKLWERVKKSRVAGVVSWNDSKEGELRFPIFKKKYEPNYFDQVKHCYRKTRCRFVYFHSHRKLPPVRERSDSTWLSHSKDQRGPTSLVRNRGIRVTRPVVRSGPHLHLGSNDGSKGFWDFSDKKGGGWDR